MAVAVTARRVARSLYLILILVFLAGVIVQALLAGGFLFGTINSEAHVSLGWPLAHMLAPLVFLLSLFLGGGRSFWITSLVWGVLVVVQPIFAGLGMDGPNNIAALHVINAMFVFTLTVWLCWRAWNLAVEVPQAKTAPSQASRAAVEVNARGVAPPARR